MGSPLAPSSHLFGHAAGQVSLALIPVVQLLGKKLEGRLA